MRISITSSLLAVLLAQLEWEGASAFGVDSRPSKTAPSSSSSLRAAEIVDAIANGAASAVTDFDVLNNISIEEIKNVDPSKMNIIDDAIKNINLDAIKNNLSFGVSTGSATAVGGAFGTAGFLVGSLTSNSAQIGESKRMANEIEVQSQKIEELSADLAAAEETVSEVGPRSPETKESSFAMACRVIVSLWVWHS